MNIDGLLDAAESGNLLITQSLVETIKYDDAVLMIAYYLAKKRALKLTPNITLRQDLNLKVLKNRFKHEKDKSLVEQGEESEACANYLYRQFNTTSTNNVTLFAFVLCKLNQYDTFYNFISLYREQINFHFKSKDGKTMLHVAAKKGNVDKVKLLIDCCDINSQDNIKKTALHHAVKKYHYDIVELLLQHHANIGIKDNGGQTPLHYVSPGQNGNERLFNLLLKYGGDINQKYKHQTLLYYGVHNNYAETVQYLLEKGANPFIPSRVKQTNNYEKVYELPLTLASKSNFHDINDQINNFQIILLLNRYMLKV